MEKIQSPLRYFLSETHYFERDYSILVVTLVGPISEENIPIFLQCADQISKSTAKWVIVNFRDVPSILDKTLVPSLQKLLNLIRTRPAGLRLSGIHPQLRKVLEEQNIALEGEIASNFAEALDSLPIS